MSALDDHMGIIFDELEAMSYDPDSFYFGWGPTVNCRVYPARPAPRVAQLSDFDVLPDEDDFSDLV